MLIEKTVLNIFLIYFVFFCYICACRIQIMRIEMFVKLYRKHINSFIELALTSPKNRPDSILVDYVSFHTSDFIKVKMPLISFKVLP